MKSNKRRTYLTALARTRFLKGRAKPELCHLSAPHGDKVAAAPLTRAGQVDLDQARHGALFFGQHQHAVGR